MRNARQRIVGGLINLGLTGLSFAFILAVSETALYFREVRMMADCSAPVDPAMGSAGIGLAAPPSSAFAWNSDGNGLIHVRSEDPRLVYELRPNIYLNEYLQTNSMGFRDEEFSLDKPEGVCRIVVLGDSVAFGWEEAAEDIFSEVLEDMLNALTPGSRRFEVCNMSVGGYGAGQELELLRTKVPPLHPDAVVLQYCFNDNLVGVDAGLWRHFTRSPLRTWDFIKLRGMELLEKVRPEKTIERDYRAIASIVKENGWPFLVMVMPAADQDSSEMCAFLDTLPLANIYPYKLFEACGFKRVFTDSVHLETFGHRLAVEEVFRYLVQTLPCAREAYGEKEPPNFELVRKTFLTGWDRQDAGDLSAAEQYYRDAAGLDSGYAPLCAKQMTIAARGMLNDAHFAEALPVARAAVSFSPGNLLAVQALGLAAYAQGLYTESVEALEKTVKRAPGSALLWRELGEARSHAGDIVGALLAFNTSFDTAPEYRRDVAVFLREEGEVELSRKQTNRAQALLEAAVKVLPDDAPSWNALGEAARDNGAVSRALEAFERATLLDADAPVYQLNYGTALESSGQHEKACLAFRRAIVLEPEETGSKVLLAAALLAAAPGASGGASSRSEAEELLATAFSKGIDATGTLLLAASCFQMLGKTEMAVEGYVRAIEREPMLFQAAEQLYRAVDSSWLLPEQCAFWDGLAGRLSSSTHIWFFQGIAQLRNHRPEEAGKAFEQAVQLYPENAGAWRFLGETRLLEKQFPQAEAAFREALRIAPDLEGADKGLLHALFWQRKFAEARDIWRTQKHPQRNP